MLSMLSMYLLVKCTAIQIFFISICSVTFLIFLISIIALGIRLSEDYGGHAEQKIKKEHKPYTWPMFAVGCLFLLLSLAMPDTKEMAIIYVTPKVVNSVMANEELRKLPSNLVGLANAWIEEFKPDTNTVKDTTENYTRVKKENQISDSTKQTISDKVIDRVIKEVTK